MGRGCLRCPGTEPAIGSRMDGQTDGQTGSQPQLCLHGLSYHLLLGEGSSQLIQILPQRREEGVKIAEQPVTTSPAGFCAQLVEELNKAGPRRRTGEGSAAALPQPRAVTGQRDGTEDGDMPWQRMGTCQGRGWGHAMVKDARSPPAPARQSHAGACALARDQPVPAAGTLAMGKGSGTILWVPAQAAWPRVPVPMSRRGWPHAEGRRSRRAHPSARAGAGGAGQSVAQGQTAAAESRSCVAPTAVTLRSPREGGDLRHRTADSKRGEKPSPAEFCAI